MSVPTLDRIRPCAECGRMTRPSHFKAMEHPGTVVRGNATRCITCYAALRVPPVAAGVEAPKSVVLATVTVRYPQRADCRPSCCKTPYNCAREFQCRCHGDES